MTFVCVPPQSPTTIDELIGAHASCDNWWLSATDAFAHALIVVPTTSFQSVLDLATNYVVILPTNTIAVVAELEALRNREPNVLRAPFSMPPPENACPNKALDYAITCISALPVETNVVLKMLLDLRY